MRFGIAVGQNINWETQRRLFRAADEVELWESAWSGDHFYPFLSTPTGPCLEGWMTLASLSQHTHRLRIGQILSVAIRSS